MKHAYILAGLIALIGVVPAGIADEPVKGPFSHVIPNIPGKSLTAVEVSYAPGQASPPHHHAKSAFIYVYVLSGQIASQVDGQPERIYKAGESFYETPGAHHLVSRNASQTEPAKMLAVFVVDTDDKPLTTTDK
jgi:quercetin dioxygenase-like cupin family protein